MFLVALIPKMKACTKFASFSDPILPSPKRSTVTWHGSNTGWLQALSFLLQLLNLQY